MRRRLARIARAARPSCLLGGGLLLAACAPPHSPYFPLAASHWWYYEISETILDEPRASRYVVFNAGRRRVEGADIFVQTAQHASLDWLQPAGAGVIRVASRRPGTGLVPDSPPRIVLPERLDPGVAWTASSTLGLIESRTFARADRIIVRRVPITVNKSVAETGLAVTVAAGRFENCVRVDGSAHAFVATDRGNSEAAVTVQIREWYAPGVGLVRLERTESSGSSFLKSGRQTWELADYGE